MGYICRLCGGDEFAALHRPGPMPKSPTRTARPAAVMRANTCSTGAGARPTAQEVASLVAGYTIGGRPSSVILTTVRQRIGCRTGRADHASR
jgi:hypothetical protein